MRWGNVGVVIFSNSVNQPGHSKGMDGPAGNGQRATHTIPDIETTTPPPEQIRQRVGISWDEGGVPARNGIVTSGRSSKRKKSRSTRSAARVCRRYPASAETDLPQ